MIDPNFPYCLILLFWLCVLIGIVFMLGRCTANAAEVDLPMKVKIINLTHETLEDAIAYCDERNMPCPELRAQYDPVNEVEFEPLPQDLNEIEPAGGIVYE